MEKKREELRQKLAQSDNTVKSKEADLLKKAEEIDGLKREMKEMRTSLKESDKNCNLMEKKYKNAEHLKERQVQKVKDLNEQIATVNEVMDDMTNELEMFRKRYMGDQMLVNGVKKECDGLKEKLTKADGKSKEQQEINNDNKKKLDELKKENDKWKVMNQHFVQLNCDLEKERDSLNEK